MNLYPVPFHTHKKKSLLAIQRTKITEGKRFFRQLKKYPAHNNFSLFLLSLPATMTTSCWCENKNMMPMRMCKKYPICCFLILFIVFAVFYFICFTCAFSHFSLFRVLLSADFSTFDSFECVAIFYVKRISSFYVILFFSLKLFTFLN